MSKHRKTKRKSQQGNADLRAVIIKIIIGSTVGVALFFILTAAFSFIVLKTDMSEDRYKYFVVAFGAIMGFVCGFVTVRPIKKRGALLGSVSVVPASLTILLVAFYFGHSGVGSAGWIFAGISIIFAMLGGTLAM